MNSNPIGIFDSGVGGTSIWKAINTLLPNEDTIYLADSANAPYGPKGQARIVELATKNVENLIAQNCKLIVIACNTATTNAIKLLRSHYNVPFIGIEPALKPAALQTQTKAVGILATKGTLNSELFHSTSDLYANGIKIIEQEGEGIVQLIESGKMESEEMTALLKQYLTPMIKAKIDYLVLGCTHYPYLMPQLLKLLPKHIKIIDSGEAVARQTKTILEKKNMLNWNRKMPEHKFFSNGNPEVMKTLLDGDFDVIYLDF